MMGSKFTKRTFCISIERGIRHHISGDILDADTGEHKKFKGVLELLKIIDMAVSEG